MKEYESDVSQDEYELLSEFRYALRRFLAFSKEEAQSVGLTPKQHQALLTIKGIKNPEQGVSIGYLAERLQIHHNSAVGLVDRLVEKELVERDQMEDDHRKVSVKLTQWGEEILKKLTATHKRELRKIGPELNHLLEKITKESG